MINVKKQKKHTKLFEIHKILSKHDRRICQKNNIVDKFVAKRSKVWMNKTSKRNFQSIKTKVWDKRNFKDIRSRWTNDAFHELFRSSTWVVYSAKRTINRILFQEIDSRKSKLYYNRQENVSHSNESCLLKNIHSKIQKKNHSLHKSQNLLSFLHDKKLNQRQMRWAKKITHYDFEIKHIKRTNNIVVDVLNRRANYEATKKISKSLLKRNETMLKRAKTFEKIWDVIRQAHDSRTSKHQNVIKTLKRVQKTTNMHILKKHVEKFIKNCSKCAMTKIDRLEQINKLQSLKSSKRSYQNIALNFIIKFSKSKNLTTKVTYDMIMIVINEFIKHAKFISCKITMIAKQLTFLLLKTIYCEDEISKKIISYRDKLFIFKFMRRLI